MKQAMQKLLAVFLIVMVFAPVSITQTVPSDWQKIDAEGLFAFSLPQGFTRTNMTGIEVYLGEYYKGKTRFLFISGDTDSNAYDVRHEPEMEDYEETETTISGRRANIRTYSLVVDGARVYHAELNVGDWEHANVELFMELESANAADMEVAKQIFASVSFPKKALKARRSKEQ